jgi:UDPglucose--hexose-1-phosphate uridylyltransferase
VTPVRHDPLTGEPVLLAPARAGRPHDSQEQPSAQGCPFCEGAEDQTPPETLAVRPGGGPPDGPGWLVRAFPNKFPALAPDEGVHEVVVSTPRHVIAFADLTDEEAARAAGAWWARLRAISEDPRALWPFLFLNQGAAAGASLQHSHAQLVGLPFAPPRLIAHERAFDHAAACPVCVDLAGAGPRCVAEADGLAAWYPEVPPLSGVVRIAPVVHAPDWADASVAESAGRLLRDLLGRVGRAFGAEALNLWLHERRPGGSDRFHWHLDAVPRLGTLAGLELGAGVVAVLQAPEAAAERLRAAGA